MKYLVTRRPIFVCATHDTMCLRVYVREPDKLEREYSIFTGYSFEQYDTRWMQFFSPIRAISLAPHARVVHVSTRRDVVNQRKTNCAADISIVLMAK